MRGLYVHIPFCKQRCFYCDFSSTTIEKPQLRREFLEALQKQMHFVQNRFGKLEFDTFYVGGGTPSRLSIEEMAEIFDLVRSSFKINSDAEITCEVNPGDVTQEKARAYRKIGINRISLGAQAFQDSILQSIGRPYRVSEINKSFRLFRDSGFDNISFDLMIRLPAQTVNHVRESLAEIVRLNPEQVTVYDLDIHEKTVFGVKQAKGDLQLPGPELHEQMFRLVEEMLREAGYQHYELMTFAKPGFESRHNLIYWRNQEYLGLGPSAVSYLSGVRFELAHEIRKYIHKCLKNDFQPEAEDVLSPEQKETETLLTGLRLLEGVCVDEMILTGSRIQKKISEFQAAGFFEKNRKMLALTRKGRAVSEIIFCELAKSSCV